MNWNIEIDNNNKIIIDEATNSNCWEEVCVMLCFTK